jgi:hypothetical protein
VAAGLGDEDHRGYGDADGHDAGRDRGLDRGARCVRETVA